MTSGRFTSFPLGGIIVAPDRQRKELRNIEELAESIGRLGLINPVTLQRDGTLVAGERRYTACRLLGWTDIPAQFTDDVSAYDLKSIELEENVKRENLTWQEEVMALQELHAHKLAAYPDWTQSDTAASVGISQAYVAKCLGVAKEMENEKVAGADKLSSAVNLVQRSTERRKAHALAGVGAVLGAAVAEDVDGEVAAPVEKAVPLLNLSFHDWQPTYTGPKFSPDPL
jgi:ParB/RepB/Spo0J family partition protein